MKRLVVLTLAIIFFGCNGPTQGIVTAKKYEPAHMEQRSCFIGKFPSSCPVYVNDAWKIHVCDGDNCAWLKVSKSKFDSLETGSKYRGENQP